VRHISLVNSQRCLEKYNGTQKGEKSKEKYGIKMIISKKTPKHTNKNNKKIPKPVDVSVVANMKGISWPFLNVGLGLISDTTCQ